MIGRLARLASQDMTSDWSAAQKCLSYLRVLDDEMSWREDECDEGCGKQHLDNSDIAIIAAEDFGEGIGVVDAETLRGTCGKRRAVSGKVGMLVKDRAPTARQSQRSSMSPPSSSI